MAPFSWLPYLFAAFCATTSFATPARDIVKPKAVTLPYESPSDIMYADLYTLVMIPS